MTVKIAVDAMGGDNSPAVEVAGAVVACREWGCEVVLVGDTAKIQAELDKHEISNLSLEIHHASEVVGMHDSPLTHSARRKIRQFGSLLISFSKVWHRRLSARVIPALLWQVGCLFLGVLMG